MMRSLLPLLATGLVLSAPLSHAEDKAGTPSPTAVKAEGEVTLVASDGKTGPLASGAAVPLGARVRTGESSDALIRYPDGSEVYVGRGTEILLDTGKDETPRVELEKGIVRGMIQKKVSDPQKKPVFYFRTKNAVMGVRGTDFFYGFDAALEKADIHTLEGVVEVAKDEATILRNEGSKLLQNQAISADANGLGQVTSFDPKEFLESITGSQPFLAAAGAAPGGAPPVPSVPSVNPGAAAGALGALALLGGGGDDEDDAKKDTNRQELKKEEPAKKEEQPAQAPAAAEPPRDTAGLHLFRFAVGMAGLDTHDGAGGSRLEVAFTPELRLGDNFAIRGHVGFIPRAFSAPAGLPEDADTFIVFGAHAEATIWRGLTLGLGYLRHNIIGASTEGSVGLQAATGIHPEIAWRFHPFLLLDRVSVSSGNVSGFGTNPLGAPENDFNVFRLSLGLRLF